MTYLLSINIHTIKNIQENKILRQLAMPSKGEENLEKFGFFVFFQRREKKETDI